MQLSSAPGARLGGSLGAGRMAWASPSSASFAPGRGLRTDARSSSAQGVIAVNTKDLQWQQVKHNKRAADDAATIQRLEAERATLQAELAASREARIRAASEAVESRLSVNRMSTELAAREAELEGSKASLRTERHESLELRKTIERLEAERATLQAELAASREARIRAASEAAESRRLAIAAIKDELAARERMKLTQQAASQDRLDLLAANIRAARLQAKLAATTQARDAFKGLAKALRQELLNTLVRYWSLHAEATQRLADAEANANTFAAAWVALANERACITQASGAHLDKAFKTATRLGAETVHIDVVFRIPGHELTLLGMPECTLELGVPPQPACPASYATWVNDMPEGVMVVSRKRGGAPPPLPVQARMRAKDTAAVQDGLLQPDTPPIGEGGTFMPGNLFAAAGGDAHGNGEATAAEYAAKGELVVRVNRPPPVRAGIPTEDTAAVQDGTLQPETPPIGEGGAFTGPACGNEATQDNAAKATAAAGQSAGEQAKLEDTAEIRLQLQREVFAKERESERRAFELKLESVIADVRASVLEERSSRMAELEAELAEVKQDNLLMRAERCIGMEKRHVMLEELRHMPGRRVSNDVSAMQDGLLQPGARHTAHAQDQVVASDAELRKQHQMTLLKLNKFGLTINTSFEPVPDAVPMPTADLADLAAGTMAAAEAAAQEDERKARGRASPVSLQPFAQATEVQPAMLASEALSGNGGGSSNSAWAALPDDDVFEASLCASFKQPAAAAVAQLAAPAADTQGGLDVDRAAGWGARWGSGAGDTGVAHEPGTYRLFG